MEYCHRCDQLIDTDYNAEHFEEHNVFKGIIGLEGLVPNKVMPLLYAYMLEKGEEYLTGSDYTYKELARIIN